MCCSALESSSHGAATSTAAKARSGTHLRRAARSPSRDRANGRRISAATPVRKNTNVGGESSPTAIRMKRYGMPQITHMAANSNRPRRLTGFLTYRHGRGFHVVPQPDYTGR